MNNCFRKTCIECSYRYSWVEEKLFKCFMVDSQGCIFAFSISCLPFISKMFFVVCLLICVIIGVFKWKFFEINWPSPCKGAVIWYLESSTVFFDTFLVFYQTILLKVFDWTFKDFLITLLNLVELLVMIWIWLETESDALIKGQQTKLRWHLVSSPTGVSSTDFLPMDISMMDSSRKTFSWRIVPRRTIPPVEISPMDISPNKKVIDINYWKRAFLTK